MKNFFKKEYLVPLEKSKRTIYLDKRGRKKGRLTAGVVLTAALAVICMAYCLAIAWFMGYGTSFFLIWGVLSFVFAGATVILWRRVWTQGKLLWLKRGAAAVLVIAALLFAGVEGMICTEFHAKAQPGAEYVLILGAQWKSTGPGYMLKKRLDTAAEYLQANPAAKAVVSGGQGSNEPIAEAEGMRQYLLEKGIAPERIIMEGESGNTVENLLFSSACFDKTQDRIVIVTNDFHMFRALKIAQKQGYTQVEGLSADSYPAMLPNNMLREFFGVLKDFWKGNL